MVNLLYDYLQSPTNINVKLTVLDTLATFNNIYEGCQLCPLHLQRDTEHSMVMGMGVVKPKVMFIGEGPSAHDATIGRPFSDKAGEKVSGMVQYLSRFVDLTNNLYTTNIVLCAGDSEEAIPTCNQRLIDEIKLVSPRVIVILGDRVFEALREKFIPGTISTRGKVLMWKYDKYYSVVQTHRLVDLLFRQQEVQLEVKEDLDLVVKVLSGQTNGTK